VAVKEENLFKLEAEDADICMDGKQCIGLGLQISQLKDNIGQLK
jgi:hypothetical protein